MRKYIYIVGSTVLGVLPCLAASGDVLDMTATGNTLAGYIAGAAAAALAIFAGLYGIRVIIRAFRAVK